MDSFIFNDKNPDKKSTPHIVMGILYHGNWWFWSGLYITLRSCCLSA